ncbi:hypothetical protein [Paenibacillus amylolyticus]|nr:hypothetical protein [Paenibacillus amylolyticus]
MNNTLEQKLARIKYIRDNSLCMLEGTKINCAETSKNSKTRLNHRIQKSTYLKKISVNNKAWHFNIYGREHYRTNRKMVLNNIKYVHTHPMLCGKHDKDIFNAIEDGHLFEEGNMQQYFQFAFRAFIFDFYEYCLKMEFKHPNKWIEKRAQLAYNEKIKIFEKFVECYKQNEYEAIETTVLKLDREVDFVSCTKINPLVDVKGKYRLQGELHGCYLNIFPQKGVTYILLSYFKENKRYCEKLINEFKLYENKKQYNVITMYLNKVVASHDMNLVMSPRLYESWSRKEKEEFHEYANLMRVVLSFKDIIKIYKKLKNTHEQFDLFKNVQPTTTDDIT